MKEHWFLLAEDTLHDALVRARKGESPDALLMQLWSLSNHYDDPTEDDDLLVSVNGITTFTLTVPGEE